VITADPVVGALSPSEARERLRDYVSEVGLVLRLFLTGMSRSYYNYVDDPWPRCEQG